MAAATPAKPGSPRPLWPFWLRQSAWAALDLVFTPQCASCRAPGARLCAACHAAIQRLGPQVCAECGHPLNAHGRCRSGGHPVKPLAGLRSAASYAGPLQPALHRLKYKRDLILADTLARELADAWRRYALPAGTVIAVPLAAERQRERGYNQAALLARGLADLARLPYQAEGLARVRHTPSQVGLTAEARRANVRGAFAARRDRVAGRAYILVDDICTTGATLTACAEALHQAGAKTIWGLTLGRALAPGGKDIDEGTPSRPAQAG